MRSRTEMTAITMPTPQGRTAAPGCTLSSIASRLATKHSSHGIGALPASDNRNGEKNSKSQAADMMSLACMTGRSEAADTEDTWARAAAGLGQALAAIGGRAAVIAVMAAHVVPIT